MSYNPRATPILPSSSIGGTSSLRHSSLGGNNNSNITQSNVLTARIAAKRQELENLKQLRDLSANLASQMAVLESKLATLRDGAESVACVLANWDNVLKAINMASTKLQTHSETQNLPTTLVRIPVTQEKENGG